MVFTLPRMPQQRQPLYALVIFILLLLATRHFWNIHAQQPPPPPEPIKREWSKIAKVTVAINNSNATGLDRCIHSHEVQNEMHGYQHFVGSTMLVSEQHVPSAKMSARWSKHAYLLQILLTELQKPESERLEWLFWFDADTLILNPHIALETFLPPAWNPIAANLKLLIARNWNDINDGALLLRVDLWSVSLLSSVLAWPTYHLGQNPLPHEQTVLSTVLHTIPEYQHNWTVVPHRWFNSFPVNNVFEWVKGKQMYILDSPMEPRYFDDGERIIDAKNGRDFTLPWKVLKGNMALHFAGVKDRKTWVDPWADRAEMMLPEWSGTPHQEKLQDEVHQFWVKWHPKVQIRVVDKRPIDGLNNPAFF